PPVSGMRQIPFPARLKMITPSRFQEPPPIVPSAMHSGCEGPPATAIFLQPVIGEETNEAAIWRPEPWHYRRRSLCTGQLADVQRIELAEPEQRPSIVSCNRQHQMPAIRGQSQGTADIRTLPRRRYLETDDRRLGALLARVKERDR